MIKRKRKRKKESNNPFALHKNRLFFGVFAVMVFIFSMSLVQQRYGDLTGVAVKPIVEEHVGSIYDDEHTEDGKPCIREIEQVQYIHPDCVD
jgi:hypothetical protein